MIHKLQFRISQARYAIDDLWAAYLLVGSDCDRMDYMSLKSMAETLTMIAEDWEKRVAESEAKMKKAG